jgi:hypothetical protein
MMGPQDAVKMKAKLKKFDELQSELDNAYYHLTEASKLQNHNLLFVVVPGRIGHKPDINIRITDNDDIVLRRAIIKTLMDHWNNEVNRIKAKMKEL